MSDRTIECPATPPSGSHEFPPLERVVFGAGKVETLRGELERLGASRALIVTGRTLARETDLVARLESLLGELGAGAFDGTRQHAPRDTVLATAAALRETGADAVVSFGGSSAIDTTKLATLCLGAGVETAEELGEFKIGYPFGEDAGASPGREAPARTIPHVAIPTTLSAGEHNGWAGSTDPQRGVKESYGGASLTPRAVVLDPELTLATPGWLWGSTGMRAMDHAVETVYSDDHQPFADGLCVNAAANLLACLERTREEPSDLAARGTCQIAAWMSITPLTSVRTGICHAIGLQLGARRDVPHGVTSAIMLPEAMGFNLPASAARQAKLARAMGLLEDEMDDEAAGRAVADRLRELVRDLGIDNRLRDWGVGEDDLAPLAATTSIAPANPVPYGPTEVEYLLRKAL